MLAVGMGAACLVLGLFAGLWLHRLRSRWCPRCGEWTLERPLTAEEERQIRHGVQAKDPIRGVALPHPVVPAAGLSRLTDRS
jgi:hypothetical protein